MISPKKVKKKKKKHWYTENWKTLEGGENGKLIWWADFDMLNLRIRKMDMYSWLTFLQVTRKKERVMVWG